MQGEGYHEHITNITINDLRSPHVNWASHAIAAERAVSAP